MFLEIIVGTLTIRLDDRLEKELARLAKETETDVARQLRLLAVYSALAGRAELKTKVMALANTLSVGIESGKA